MIMTDCTENRILEIEQNAHVTTIKNHSQYKLIISVLPVKPKIKSRDFMILPKQMFWIDEHGLDLTKISLRFEE